MPSTRMGLGIVIPGFGGTYDPAVEYEYYVYVRDGCDTYISKKASKGVPTSNTEYWYRATDIKAFLSDPDAKSQFLNELAGPVRDAVNDAIGNIAGFTALVVDALPDVGEPGVIYFLPEASGEKDNYDEYIWVADRFELIGNTTVDLSGYVPMDRTINGKGLFENIELSAADLGIMDETSMRDAFATGWAFMRDGNPVAISPAAGSTMRITASVDCAVLHNGGDPISVTAGAAIQIKAMAGVNTLAASAGALHVEYNSDSMDVLEQLTVKTTATGTVARIAGAVSDLPLDVIARCVATQEGAGSPSPENARPIIGKSAVNVTRVGGANLLPEQWLSSAFEKIGDEWISTVDITSLNAPRVYPALPVGAYTITADISSPVGLNYRLAVRYIGGTSTIITPNTSTGSFLRHKATTDATKQIDFIEVVYSTSLGSAGTIKIKNLMCVLGATAADYEPFTQKTTYQINLPVTLYGLPGAQDELRSNGAIIKRTGHIPSYNGEEIPGEYISSTGGLDVGAQIVYALAEPEIYAMAPFVIPSLPGANSLFTDGGGSTTATGRQGAQGLANRLSALEAAFPVV